MTRKIIPYILILVMLVGFFGPVFGGVPQARAQAITGDCAFLATDKTDNTKTRTFTTTNFLQTGCVVGAHSDTTSETIVVTSFVQTGTQSKEAVSASSGGTGPTESGNVLQNAASSQCTVSPSTWFSGCLVYAAYWIFYALPAEILAITANMFNSMLALTLSSVLYHNAFIPGAWAIVRDLSNIFFILILLYIAVKVILDLGHDSKKMIAMVILMALLINFSMFFTEVIIDSSNVLALIFYNKISVNPDPAHPRSYDQTFTGTGVTEKDFGGAIAGGFNPAGLMDASMFAIIPGSSDNPKCLAGDLSYCTDQNPSTSISFMLSIIFVSCAIFLVASYAFFVAMISFLGRLIELWVLIIFSPFAFMSSTVPLLSGVEDIGWSSWFKKLMKTAFMAPIFMLMMYIISLIVKINIFSGLTNTTNTGFLAKLLLIIIPASIDISLLLMAVKFAKKGGGMLGEIADKTVKMAGGLALGAATGGAAMLGTATIGRAGAAMANSEWAKKREAEGKFGSRLFTKTTGAMGSASFDVRATKAGGALAKATGMNIGEAKKGGFEQRRKEQTESRQKRMKELEVGEDEPLKQNVRTAENTLQTVKSDQTRQDAIVRLNNGDTTAPVGSIANQGLGALERAVTTAERGVVDADRTLKDAVDRFGATSGAAGLARMNRNAAVTTRDTAIGNLETRQGAVRTEEAPIKAAEAALKIAENAVTGENRTRRVNYAQAIQTPFEQTKQFFFTFGNQSPRGAREAANKIRAGIQEEKK